GPSHRCRPADRGNAPGREEAGPRREEHGRGGLQARPGLRRAGRAGCPPGRGQGAQPEEPEAARRTQRAHHPPAQATGGDVMANRILNGGLLLSSALLAACANQQRAQVLAYAEAGVEQVKEDPDVLRSAPKDVIRAGESLPRAERLSSYWGSAADVEHYAYL